MSNILQNELVDTSISKLYLESDLADVSFAFKCNGPVVLVPAHKLILASGSSVFRTMFFGSLPEKDTVEIVDATAEEFKEFLQFFYLRKIKLTMDNMEGVSRLADKYDILDCLNSCAAFLETQLTDNNMLWGYQLAITLGNQKLKLFCEGKIADLSADMFKTEAFLNCDRNILKNILLMNELGCEETLIFEACKEWAKTALRKNQLNENDSKSLKEQLGDCIYLIEFGRMTNERLGAILDNKLYADMFDRDEILELRRISLMPNFNPKIFIKLTRNKNPENSTRMKLVRCNKLYKYRKLESKETTRFTSNIPLLLGQINFCSIIERVFDFDVINCNSNQMLHKGRLNSSDQRVFLNEGILIKPQEMYMIRVYFPLNVVGSRALTTYNEQVVIKDEGHTDIIINFPDSNDVIVSDLFVKRANILTPKILWGIPAEKRFFESENSSETLAKFMGSSSESLRSGRKK